MKNKTKIGLLATLVTIGTGVLIWSKIRKKEPINDLSKTNTVETSAEIQEDHFISDEMAATISKSKRWMQPAIIKRKRDSKPVELPKKRTTRYQSIIEAKLAHDRYYKWLHTHFKTLQITIKNKTNTPTLIRLWGSNTNATSVSPTLNTSTNNTAQPYVQIKSVVVANATNAGINPQNVVFNPANGFMYIVNQTSDNISILDAQGNIVALVHIPNTIISGLRSPVALAVNTNTSSPNYGKVYVAASVSNTVEVIDLTHQFVSRITVGSRPLALAFNPNNEKLYVANYASDTLSIIDTKTETILNEINTARTPSAIAINTNNNDVYIGYRLATSITVFDGITDTLTTSIASIGNFVLSMTYNPKNNTVYAVENQNNQVIPIDASNYNILPSIATGTEPRTVLYNPNDDNSYVSNSIDNTITVIDSNHTVINTIENIGTLNIGFAFNLEENTLFITDTALNTINIFGRGCVQINADYFEKAEEFKFNPILVKHVKFSLSGTARFKVLNRFEKTPTGTVDCTPISHEQYRSPQSIQNISEITSLNETLVDGKVSWEFTIAPNQTISILLYYKQFLMEQQIPTKKISR